jgi:hypothetical protein
LGIGESKAPAEDLHNESHISAEIPMTTEAKSQPYCWLLVTLAWMLIATML